ncbi:MAG TPA: SEC-C metal-binding domain-containing protein [Burkholderiales bacterium]|nr:SEC-C metal-binding domain-containing protein [Burkholderiales bacterium]
MNPALKENNYLHVPELITPARAAELAQEFFRVEEEGRYTTDGQAPNSPAIYNFLPFVRLMVEKVPLVSELCGEPVLPTYAYGRIYKHGEELKRHRDRDACEISWTLNLAQDADWPIFIQKPNGEAVGMNLQPGDAIMYLGCDADHWREQFAGQNFVQVFIHYVRAHGPRAYTFFDRDKTPPILSRRPPPAPVNQKSQPVAQEMPKVGRNEACPCGSGKKFKHCHGRAA